MAERPILFSAPMVRAILDGRKTQTRRIVTPQPPTTFTPVMVVDEEPPCSGNIVGEVSWCLRDQSNFDLPRGESDWLTLRCPYGAPGDTLWVRETWRPYIVVGGMRQAPDSGIFYEADGARISNEQGGPLWRIEAANRNRPSIHMPRWASRITLKITGVRVEQLQEISEADARAEGWSDLWDEINGKGAWAANPWVWAVSFKLIPTAPAAGAGEVKHA